MTASPGSEFLRRTIELIDSVLTHEIVTITAAAHRCADAIADGGLIHAFGTGHSHMIAEELFYRAGGLVAVNPILVDDLMLHVSATDSTRRERLASEGEAVLTGVDISPGDAIIIASNSGGNAVCDVLAVGAKDAGASVIAIVSRAHAATSRRPKVLLDVADVIIDNHGVPGDAAITIPGVAEAVGPTSSIAGAAIVNAMAAEVVALLARRNVQPAVFASSNSDGGDAHNAEVMRPFRGRIRSL